MSAAEEFDTWEATQINTKGKTNGNIKTLCPKCSHDRKPHNRKDPCLSVNLDDQVFDCKNCEWTGYVRRFPKSGSQKKYDQPDYKPMPVTDKMVKWFTDKRGITPETLAKFLIFPNRKWIPKAQKEVDCIGFPYVENGSVVNVKSRYDYIEVVDGEKRAAKTFVMEKGAKKVLYNVDAVKGQERVIITEGEPDCMSVHQAGWLPVCSVPNGAPPLQNKPGTPQGQSDPLPLEQQPQLNLDYLDDADIVFAAAKEIIIATDGDMVGMRLRNEIARRLGKDRCKFIAWPDGIKDFNKVLQDYQEEGVMRAIEEWSEAFPIEGITRVEDILDEVDSYYLNGYPKGKNTHHKGFNRLLTFRPGEVTTVTGIPSHGKSEFMDELLVNLSELHGWQHAIFGAENGGAGLHTTRIIHRYIQKPVVEDRLKNLFPKMEPDEFMRGKVWVNEFFNWIDLRKVGRGVDDILAIAKKLVLTRGIKVLLIDPWNYLEANKPQGMTDTEYVSVVYAKLVMFAEDSDVHVFVVAHPTKMLQNEDGTFKVPNLYSISGSANFYNKTFNGMTVYRDFAANITKVFVQKVKFDFVGERGVQEFGYNPFKRRYYEV